MTEFVGAVTSARYSEIMPPDSLAIADILRLWPLPPPERIESLGNAGGFSGAQLWRLTVGPAQFCLRKWPDSTKPERVATIASILRHVQGYQRPLSFVSYPLESRDKRPLVIHDNEVWTLSPWMPGAPISSPSRAQLQSAMQALALFHDAVADHPEYPRKEIGSPSRGGSMPPVLMERLELLSQLDLGVLAKAVIPPRWEAVSRHRRDVLAFFRDFPIQVLLDRFAEPQQLRVPLQICLRDVWSAHVLFTGDVVTGLIDFDALRVDSIALDLARLLGSYGGDDDALWVAGFDRYQAGFAAAEHVVLTAAERKLARLYDELAVILTPVQWLSWILLEGREFGPAVVLPRLDATQQRLEHLRNRLRTSAGLIL